MKKVIFIGGTSYSGSTFFDMILANDPKGFSCGEVHALFNPYRSHHINPMCGCGNEDCNLWQHVLSRGPKNLYNTIFELLPDVDFIVDSSKNPYWIRSQVQNLSKKNIPSKHILIWKTPLEFAYSYQKRGQANWHKEWTSYHRSYFTALKEWRAVMYHEFINNPDVLKRACEYLEIPYFPAKVHYWEKKHHTLFGNASAKVHLYQKNSDEYKSEEKSLGYCYEEANIKIGKAHRSIYYQKISDKYLEKSIGQSIADSKYFKGIEGLLKTRDVLCRSMSMDGPAKLRMSIVEFELRKIKQLVSWQIKKFKGKFVRQKLEVS